MTNTYPDNAPNDLKVAEELRLIRCIMERKLRHEFPQVFVDYQFEKFGPNYKTEGKNSD